MQVAMVVNSGDDIITAASNTLQENIVPIICVSAVSGRGSYKNIIFAEVFIQK
jgi:GTPase